MKTFHALVLLVVALASSVATAQDPAAPPAAAPADAPKAAPVVPLVSDDPSVQALLDTKPTKPTDMFAVVGLLVDLEQPELARAMVVKLTETATDDAALVELGRKFNKREVLRLGEVPGLQPEGKALAEKIVKAMNAADRDPARITALIQQLQAPTYEERVAAINGLRSGGDGAITALIDGLLDPNRAAEQLMLRTALAGLDDAAVAPLRVVLAAGDEAAKTAAVKTLSLSPATAVVNDLYAAAFAAGSPPTTRQAAQAALAKRLGKLPEANAAAVKLFVEANRLYKMAAPLGNATPVWKWDAATMRPKTELDQPRIVDLNLAATYAAAAADASGDATARRLADAAALEALTFSSPDPAQQATAAAAWFATRKLSPAELAALFELTAGQNRNVVAGFCLRQLTASASREQLLIGLAGQPTTLVRAATSPDPTIRFVAVDSVMNLQPTQPFAGSSGVADSLAWFATAQGTDRALVVDKRSARGRDVAGMLAGLQLSAEAFDDVLTALSAAATRADVQFVFVDRLLLEPSQGNFLARLRSDYRSARIPVAVICEPEDVDRTRTRLYEDPYTVAIIRPTDEASLKRQLELNPTVGGQTFVPGPERVRRAGVALAAMRQLLQSNNTVFNLKPYEPALLQAANSATPSNGIIGVLGQLGSPAAQRTLVDLASATSQPLALRQAAALAFGENVIRYGTLLTTVEINRQYERYNASESLDKPTQQVLASLLDVMEARAASLPARAERKTSAAAGLPTPAPSP